MFPSEVGTGRENTEGKLCFSLPNGKQSWMGPIQRGKGRQQQTGAVYGFPQAVISKPTSGIRPQSAEQTDSRVMLMMHVPKNAELFLYEQLCRRSQLTQCSASPPLELWAKMELRRHQEWRKGPGFFPPPWLIWGQYLGLEWDVRGWGELPPAAMWASPSIAVINQLDGKETKSLGERGTVSSGVEGCRDPSPPHQHHQAGIGLSDPHGSFPAWGTLWLYDTSLP